MKPFDERVDDVRSKWLFINTGGVHRLEKQKDVTELASMAKLLPLHAFNSGAQWSRTETIREVLELLRSDDCDKFIGLTLSYYGGEDGPSIARWLAEKLGVKE